MQQPLRVVQYNPQALPASRNLSDVLQKFKVEGATVVSLTGTSQSLSARQADRDAQTASQKWLAALLDATGAASPCATLQHLGRHGDLVQNMPRIATQQRHRYNRDALAVSWIRGDAKARQLASRVQDVIAHEEVRDILKVASRRADVDAYWTVINQVVLEVTTQVFPVLPVVQGVIERPPTTALRKAYRRLREVVMTLCFLQHYGMKL
eukprot:2315986-Amphidinium_carterae.1